MPGYDAPPLRWDHELVIGDTYAPGVVALEDDTGAAHDITGATGEVRISEQVGGTVLLSPTWALVGAGTLGTFQWTDTAANTALLQSGRYPYAVRVTFSDGSKRTVLEGFVDVRRGVLS